MPCALEGFYRLLWLCKLFVPVILYVHMHLASFCLLHQFVGNLSFHNGCQEFSVFWIHVLPQFPVVYAKTVLPHFQYKGSGFLRRGHRRASNSLTGLRITSQLESSALKRTGPSGGSAL